MNSDEVQALRERLAEAQSYLDALQNQEVDAVVGREQVLLLKLKDFEEQYASLVENLPDVIFRLDPELKHVYMSPVVKFYTGKEPDQILGKTGLEAGLFKSDWPAFERACRDLLKDGEPRHVDFQHETPHGPRFLQSRIFAENSQKGASFILGITADVTEQRTAQDALRRSEDLLKAAIEGANLGTWDYHPSSGICAHWSEGMSRLYGLDRAPSDCEDVFCSHAHPEDRTALAEAFERAENSDGIDHTHRILRPNGEIRWIRLAGRVNLSGSEKRIVGIAEDITERVNSERQLALAKETADRASRSKSDFLANMSHEVRTPLTAILGFAEILEPELQDDFGRECINSIRNNGKLLVTILNDVLDLSKIEAGKMSFQPALVSPRGIIEESLSLMQGAAQAKRLPLTGSFSENIPARIKTDANRLKQLLVNLISNAVKFTERGKVEVEASFNPETGILRIDVSDTGTGISPDFRDKLFQPFEQAPSDPDQEQSGTGLGLAICRRLSELLHGSLHLERTGPDGSVFSLLLEVQQENPDTASPEHSLAPPSTFENESPLENQLILIVDDQRDVLSILDHHLQRLGASTLLASSGSEALDLLEKLKEPPDLVLLDMRMAGVDGFETARRLRQRGFSKPIIAVTAHVMEANRDQCIEAGCSDFLRKPVDHENLVAMLRRHLFFRN